MKTMKTPGWEQVVPFAHYLSPLGAQIKKVRDMLLKMHKNGHLLIKYAIEQNKELKDETTIMIKLDQNVQLLLGDKLKQDQFKFFYETLKIIFDSAAKTELLNYEKNTAQVDEVISKLLGFRSVLLIRNI